MLLTRIVTSCYASNLKGQGECVGGEETEPVVGRLGSVEPTAKRTWKVGFAFLVASLPQSDRAQGLGVAKDNLRSRLYCWTTIGLSPIV